MLRAKNHELEKEAQAAREDASQARVSAAGCSFDSLIACRLQTQMRLSEQEKREAVREVHASGCLAHP